MSSLQMSPPRFSLILATVGRTVELDRVFASLAEQTFRDFEIIVVDQNPDERLQPYLERACGRGLHVRHLKHHPANLAAARNAGIQAARGDVIGFPDDDCWYDMQAMERLSARFAETDQPTGVILRWVEQDEQPLFASTLSWERACAFRDVSVSSITLFCKRELFGKIGSFDARLGVGQWFGAGEETDFVLRALRAKELFVYEPLGEVHHAVNAGKQKADQQTLLAVRCRARGTGALYAKHRLPTWIIIRGIVAPLLRPLLKGSLGAELALGYATTRGRIDGLLDWRKAHSGFASDPVNS